MYKPKKLRIAKAVIAPTSADLINRWLSFAQVSAASERAYRKGIKNFCKWMKEHAADISRESLVEYRKYLEQEFSAATGNLYLSSARLFVTFLYNEGLFAQNPAERLKGFKSSAAHKRSAVPADTVKKVIGSFNTSTLKGRRDKAITALMSSCGLRCCEIARANIGDIEIRHGVTILRVWGKGRADKSEFVVLPAGVYNLICSYLELRGNVASKSPLFASVSNRNRGGRLAVGSISRIIKHALSGCVPDNSNYCAHCLRHSCASQAVMAGVDIREVQKTLRHKNIATTLIYVNEKENLENPATNIVAAAFGI